MSYDLKWHFNYQTGNGKIMIIKLLFIDISNEWKKNKKDSKDKNLLYF